MGDSRTWLYQRLLGETWNTLPETIQSAHFAGEPILLRGTLDVDVGRTALGRLFRRAFGLPMQAGKVSTTLEIDGDADRERWSRNVGGWRLSTIQTAHAGGLREVVGRLEFDFELTRSSESLSYTQRALSMRLWGVPIPLPRWVAPQVMATESPAPAPFCTDIVVRLNAPGGALIVAYRGMLQRIDGAQ